MKEARLGAVLRSKSRSASIVGGACDASQTREAQEVHLRELTEALARADLRQGGKARVVGYEEGVKK